MPKLPLHIQSLQTPPDAIALQKINGEIELLGYKAFQAFTSRDVATAVLVERNLSAIQTQFESIDIFHDLITIFTRR